ncbi:MAG: DUF1465 family protein [Novosphingobium sp.]
MSKPVAINPRIIESLYGEALVLSDEVRAAFARLQRQSEPHDPEDDDLARVALSCEALRTTTRMMHAMAWLLNHRAYCKGELSAFQLRQQGKLAYDFPRSDPARVALLDPPVRMLIGTTERFYARLVRLDTDWTQRAHPAANPFSQLYERLGVAAQS